MIKWQALETILITKYLKNANRVKQSLEFSLTAAKPGLNEAKKGN